MSFARTTAGDGPNWTPTWQKQVIKTGPTLTNQGAMLAVDPRPGTPNTSTGGGTLYYGWRAFATSQNPAGIWLTSSKDFGANFGKNPVLVNKTPLQFYDQPSSGRDSLLSLISGRFVPTRCLRCRSCREQAARRFSSDGRNGFLSQGCPASGPIPPTSPCGRPAANGDPRIVLTSRSTAVLRGVTGSVRQTSGGLWTSGTGTWTRVASPPRPRRVLDTSLATQMRKENRAAS